MCSFNKFGLFFSLFIVLTIISSCREKIRQKVKEKLDKHTRTGYCSDLIDRKAEVKNIIEEVINNMTYDEDGGDGLCFLVKSVCRIVFLSPI